MVSSSTKVALEKASLEKAAGARDDTLCRVLDGESCVCVKWELAVIARGCWGSQWQRLLHSLLSIPLGGTIMPVVC